MQYLASLTVDAKRLGDRRGNATIAGVGEDIAAYLARSAGNGTIAA